MEAKKFNKKLEPIYRYRRFLCASQEKRPIEG